MMGSSFTLWKFAVTEWNIAWRREYRSSGNSSLDSVAVAWSRQLIKPLHLNPFCTGLSKGHKEGNTVLHLHTLWSMMANAEFHEDPYLAQQLKWFPPQVQYRKVANDCCTILCLWFWFRKSLSADSILSYYIVQWKGIHEWIHCHTSFPAYLQLDPASLFIHYRICACVSVDLNLHQSHNCLKILETAIHIDMPENILNQVIQF